IANLTPDEKEKVSFDEQTNTPGKAAPGPVVPIGTSVAPPRRRPWPRLSLPGIRRLPAGADLFFFNYTATPEIFTLSLHDALPIFLSNSAAVAIIPQEEEYCETCARSSPAQSYQVQSAPEKVVETAETQTQTQEIEIETQTIAKEDRKSTRLNSSHLVISYAVFCLK